MIRVFSTHLILYITQNNCLYKLHPCKQLSPADVVKVMFKSIGLFLEWNVVIGSIVIFTLETGDQIK
jgi:hypothetical protein